jgi:hypothetical protein
MSYAIVPGVGCYIAIFILISSLIFLIYSIMKKKKKSALTSIIIIFICILIISKSIMNFVYYSSDSELNNIFIFYDEYQETLILYENLNLSQSAIENISQSSIKLTIEISDVNEKIEYIFKDQGNGIMIEQKFRGISGYKGEIYIMIHKPDYNYEYNLNISVEIESNNSEINNLTIIGLNNSLKGYFKINKNDEIVFGNFYEYEEKPNSLGKWLIIDYNLHLTITKQYLS